MSWNIFGQSNVGEKEHIMNTVLAISLSRVNQLIPFHVFQFSVIKSMHATLSSLLLANLLLFLGQLYWSPLRCRSISGTRVVHFVNRSGQSKWCHVTCTCWCNQVTSNQLEISNMKQCTSAGQRDDQSFLVQTNKELLTPWLIPYRVVCHFLSVTKLKHPCALRAVFTSTATFESNV